MCRSNAVDLIQGVGELHGPSLTGSPLLIHRLASLTSKYHALLALRVQREHLESNGIFALNGEPLRARQHMARALAGQFPGALRELDCFSAKALAQRLSDLADERARALGNPAEEEPVRPWVRGVMAFHNGMRRALRLRGAARAQALSRAPLTARGQRFLAWQAEKHGPALPDDAAALERFAPGRGGNLVALVCEDVAAALGCAASEVRGWMFGEAGVSPR